jgi:hypothetical protein
MTEAKETIHIYRECGLTQALKSFGVKLINEILIFSTFILVIMDTYIEQGSNMVLNRNYLTLESIFNTQAS